MAETVRCATSYIVDTLAFKVHALAYGPFQLLFIPTLPHSGFRSLYTPLAVFLSFFLFVSKSLGSRVLVTPQPHPSHPRSILELPPIGP